MSVIGKEQESMLDPGGECTIYSGLNLIGDHTFEGKAQLYLTKSGELPFSLPKGERCLFKGLIQPFSYPLYSIYFERNKGPEGYDSSHYECWMAESIESPRIPLSLVDLPVRVRAFVPSIRRAAECFNCTCLYRHVQEGNALVRAWNKQLSLEGGNNVSESG